ncbi:MAG: hypothetical protein RR547_04755, partial [Raoultibacter sp.]
SISYCSINVKMGIIDRLRSFSTRAEAKMAVINFIECYYNRQRPHSTIDYKIPAQVMEDFFARTKPVCATIRKAA